MRSSQAVQKRVQASRQGGRLHGRTCLTWAAAAMNLCQAVQTSLDKRTCCLRPCRAAYFLVAGNEFSNGGTTAFAAGQGTGFEFMTAPWIQYEAYDIKVRLSWAVLPFQSYDG